MFVYLKKQYPIKIELLICIIVLLGIISCVPVKIKQSYSPISESKKIKIKYFLDYESSYIVYNKWPDYVKNYSKISAEKIIDGFIDFQVSDKIDADIFLKVRYNLVDMGGENMKTTIEIDVRDRLGGKLFSGLNNAYYKTPNISFETMGQDYIFESMELTLAPLMRAMIDDSKMVAYLNRDSYQVTPIQDEYVLQNSDDVPVKTSGEGNNNYALVIGNSAYNFSPLRNPKSDAEAVSQSLRLLGFNVMYASDVDLRNMNVLIDKFYSKIDSSSVCMFYYAGHGVQVDGENFLVPIDANIISESDIKFECINVSKILGRMEDKKNSMNIIILDACRNNPFSTIYRSQSRGLARIDAPVGSIIAYSTSPGRVAFDGDGNNSVYTHSFLKHIKIPNLNINDVFIRTRLDVIKATNGQQVPWESSSLTGYFYFQSKD